MNDIKQIKVDAQFALDNPDVLHTPAQYREIIEGLLSDNELLRDAIEQAWKVAKSLQKQIETPSQPEPPQLNLDVMCLEAMLRVQGVIDRVATHHSEVIAVDFKIARRMLGVATGITGKVYPSPFDKVILNETFGKLGASFQELRPTMKWPDEASLYDIYQYWSRSCYD